MNFDKIIDRKNTNAIKVDLATHRGKPSDVLPLWVADMDFKAPKCVQNEIKAKAKHGIFGYSVPNQDYYNAVKKWMKFQHNFEIESQWIINTPGVVFAIALAIRAFTEPGESVLIQTPVYYPFKNVIEQNNRKVVKNSLFEKDGKWQIDFDDFENKILANHIKLFIFCSPHNPVGRVWTHKELERINEICLKNNVIVFSDEIHNDFILSPNQHTVYSTLSEEAAQNSIVATSATKTFNLAGLQFSTIFIKNEKLRIKVLREKSKTGYDEPNIIGLVATVAAYKNGLIWLSELKKYLARNLEFVRNYLHEKIPKIKLIEPEGTYLLWLDFNAFALSDDELDNVIVNKAKLWLDRGTMFGEEGKGYQRLNIASPRTVIKEAMDRLYKVFGSK